MHFHPFNKYPVFIFTKLLLRENESSVVVELNLLVPVVAAVLIASQCLLWYKNKLPFFFFSLQREKIHQTTHFNILKGWGRRGR